MTKNFFNKLHPPNFRFMVHPIFAHKKKKKKIRGEGNRNSAPKDWEEILFIWWNTPFSHLRSFGEIHLSPALDHLIVNIYRNISKIVKDAWQCQMSIGEMEK